MREAVWWSAARLKEDGPGTRDSLVSPDEIPAMRGAGDQPPTTSCTRLHTEWSKKSSRRRRVVRRQGEPEPRAKETGSRRAAS